MKISEQEFELRRIAQLQLIQNPNYFGNLSELDIKDLPKPVLKKIGDTGFEELTCLGYNPDTQVLTAIVRIKQTSGYLGGPCTDGSQEFVRFYLDYGDGSWVDHGVASFNIHDLGFKDDLCYAVSIVVKPKKSSCCDDKPVLPKVRAILSWNDLPTANMPAWPPVWGNVLERDIQIDPHNPLICWLDKSFEVPGVEKIDPELAKQLKKVISAQPVAPKPKANLAELTAELDKYDELAVMRNIYPAMTMLAAKKTSFDSYEVLKAVDLDFFELEGFTSKLKFNTSYEELHCVGLDRDKSYLHGIVQVKRPNGYSGNLCKAGSHEYIAFYLDFGSGWVYMGTTSVVVHNISSIPAGGLWYQASLPVDLDAYRDEWCKTGRARIRGILSWSTPPTPYDPDHVAHWGDWEDCWIEIKPLPDGIQPGIFTPFLDTIGNISVSKIDAAGYATGDAVGSIYTAEDSPFGGRIDLGGGAFFPPTPLEYRIMLQGPNDPAPYAWTMPFKADVTTYPSTSAVETPVTASGDWFPYLPSTTVSVADKLLGTFKGLDDGLYTIYLEFRQPPGPVIAITPTKDFMVDNTRPSVDVEITSGTGNCGKFNVGDLIAGTFSATDLHSGWMTLHVTPGPESYGGTLAIDNGGPLGPLASLPLTESPAGADPTKCKVHLVYGNGTLDGSGMTGTWQLDTTGMKPCGYNIRLHAEDRTIVNSGGIGWESVDIEGFCVE